MGITIEEIENNFWGNAPKDVSGLIHKCYKLRKKSIEKLCIEDIRLLIEQNIALEILIPLALKALKQDLFAEGDLYEGDLLKSVLASDKKFWKNHVDYKQELVQLFISNLQEINQFDTTEEIREGIKKAFEEFRK